MMLVFISDLHLTDGSSGETINSGAFQKFTLRLEDMVNNAKAKSVEIVLLGDIFDVIRSSIWNDTTIRPWSGPLGKDSNGKTLEKITNEIVDKICKLDENKKSVKFLTDFAETMKAKNVKVEYTYVVGNHDWLINRYPETREKIANFLGMSSEQYKNEKFLLEKYAPDYKVFARHGDLYDDFNYDNDRDASSLGDAIVIELLNKFPRAVREELGAGTDTDLINSLNEIDNVRPLLDAPLWVHGACKRAKNRSEGDKVKAVWNRLVDEFIGNGFVQEHNRRWTFDIVDKLEAVLKISKGFSLSDIVKFPLKYMDVGESGYEENAYNENLMKSNNAEYIVYGHTHDHKVLPLDIVPNGNGNMNKMYFNTGTWRKVHKKTTYDEKNFEFLGWHVMTFLAFYLEEERGSYKYEVWNGVLG